VEYVPPDSEEKKGKPKAKEAEDGADSNQWGEGQKLGRGAWKPSDVTGVGGASVPVLPSRSGKSTENGAEKARSPSPDWGVDDDEMIDYDSD
jgi:ubiquitin fusion degradation protein 1